MSAASERASKRASEQAHRRAHEQANEAAIEGAVLARMLEAARAARQHAYAPYSRFAVGAALLDEHGRIHTGCNVENATYGLTLCAERVAVVKAISDGIRPHEFRRIAIVADTESPTPPCGACRQILWEFAGDIEVVLANLVAETARHSLRELLPAPFDGRLLN